MRLSKNNEQLLQENRALKEDLSKAFEEADTKPNENSKLHVLLSPWTFIYVRGSHTHIYTFTLKLEHTF